MRNLLNETLKVSEEEIDIQPEVAAAPEKIPVTPELIASLLAELPELEGVDQAELEKGLTVEQEHLASVGGEMLTIAKIVLDHIKEFPGKQYYTALEAMEHELAETPEEEEAEHAPGGEEAGIPEPIPGEQPPMESKEVPKVDDVKKAEEKK
jgi:hypothetical protein